MLRLFACLILAALLVPFLIVEVGGAETEAGARRKPKPKPRPKVAAVHYGEDGYRNLGLWN